MSVSIREFMPWHTPIIYGIVFILLFIGWENITSDNPNNWHVYLMMYLSFIGGCFSVRQVVIQFFDATPKK